MAKQYYVYILASKRNGTLYTGMTSDLVKRVWQHRNSLINGFTKTVQLTVSPGKDYRGISDELYYWAPTGGSATEVDFLLMKDQAFVAVEVKAGRLFSDSKGLRI